MKVDEIESKISKTKAIMVVHIYGLPDMNKVLYLAKKYKLYVIEDAEQLGQTYYGKPIGSLGDISTFSFATNI